MTNLVAMSDRDQTALRIQQRLKLLWLGRMHASYIDPKRLQDCFDGIPKAILNGWVDNPRFLERLSLHIARTYSMAPISVFDDNPLSALLAKGRENLRQIIRLCGAVWYANNFRLIVMAEDRKRMDDLLGPGVMAFALRNTKLSPQGMPVPMGDKPLQTMDQAGASCFAVWTRDWLPIYLSRVNLMMPPDLWPAQVTAEHVSRAPRIVSTVLAEVGT